MSIVFKEKTWTRVLIGLFLVLVVALNIMYVRMNHNKLMQEIEGLKNELTATKDQNTSLIQENEKLQAALKDYQERIDRLNGVQVPHPPEKTVYLTFDDGPSPHTEPILDILKKYNVKATFFVIGHDTENARRLYKRIVDEGHAIGNHTYSHNYGQIYQSTEAFMEDVYKMDDLIYQATGQRTKIFRFPGGTSNTLTSVARIKAIAKRILSEGYQYFDWNVDSQDGTKSPPRAEDMVKKVVSNVKHTKTSIVLMHDLASKESTLKALPTLIEQLSAMGYKFAPLDANSYYVHHR